MAPLLSPLAARALAATVAIAGVLGAVCASSTVARAGEPPATPRRKPAASTASRAGGRGKAPPAAVPTPARRPAVPTRSTLRLVAWARDGQSLLLEDTAESATGGATELRYRVLGALPGRRVGVVLSSNLDDPDGYERVDDKDCRARLGELRAALGSFDGVTLHPERCAERERLVTVTEARAAAARASWFQPSAAGLTYGSLRLAHDARAKQLVLQEAAPVGGYQTVRTFPVSPTVHGVTAAMGPGGRLVLVVGRGPDDTEVVAALLASRSGRSRDFTDVAVPPRSR